MKSRMRKTLTGLLTLVILIMAFATNVYAADTTDTGTGSVNGSVTINGSISPLLISVTHPVAAAYAIDPNTGATGTFTAPDIDVKNNTKVAVTVTVASLKAASGGALTFTDVDTTAQTWSSLNLADSKKYIALGVKSKNETGWNTGYSTATHWATKTTQSMVGTLNPAATGTMTLTANYGLAFDAAYTAKHNLVFMFQLA